MAKKTLYRTVVIIEVLSEEPIAPDIDEIVRECDDGNYLGNTNWKIMNKELVGKRAAAQVIKLGSDFDFFNMDSNGNDLEHTDWL